MHVLFHWMDGFQVKSETQEKSNKTMESVALIHFLKSDLSKDLVYIRTGIKCLETDLQVEMSIREQEKPLKIIVFKSTPAV